MGEPPSTQTAKGPPKKPRKPHSSEEAPPVQAPHPPFPQGIEGQVHPPTLPRSRVAPSRSIGRIWRGTEVAWNGGGNLGPRGGGCQGHKRLTLRLSHRHVYYPPEH